MDVRENLKKFWPITLRLKIDERAHDGYKAKIWGIGSLSSFSLATKYYLQTRGRRTVYINDKTDRNILLEISGYAKRFVYQCYFFKQI